MKSKHTESVAETVSLLRTALFCFIQLKKTEENKYMYNKNIPLLFVLFGE